MFGGLHIKGTNFHIFDPPLRLFRDSYIFYRCASEYESFSTG
jgi:hypothetical protein